MLMQRAHARRQAVFPQQVGQVGYVQTMPMPQYSRRNNARATEQKLHPVASLPAASALTLKSTKGYFKSYAAARSEQRRLSDCQLVETASRGARRPAYYAYT